MFVMYARLYFILFRAHRHMASLDASGSMSGSGSRQLETGGTTSQHDTSGTPSRHTRRLKKVSKSRPLETPITPILSRLPR